MSAFPQVFRTCHRFLHGHGVMNSFDGQIHLRPQEITCCAVLLHRGEALKEKASAQQVVGEPSGSETTGGHGAGGNEETRVTAAPQQLDPPD